MKRAIVLATALTAALFMTGCAAGSRDTASLNLPPKDLSTWAMPLDQFSSHSSALRDYAENLMVEECLGKQGIEWPVPWRPIDRPDRSPSYTSGGHRLFTQKIAAEYGYHRIPLKYQGREEQRSAMLKTNALIQKHPNIADKADACRASARKKIPVPPIDDLNYATVSAVGIVDESENDPDVRRAVKKWRECIAAEGYGGLADSPDKMPGDARSEEWKLGQPSDDVPISEAEIHTAIADARCRTSSGWDQALYDAEYDGQVVFVKKNADRLNRIRTELRKDKVRLIAAVTKYAPK